MSIYEEIKTSTRQFVFEPKIENEEKLRKFSKIGQIRKHRKNIKILNTEKGIPSLQR